MNVQFNTYELGIIARALRVAADVYMEDAAGCRADYDNLRLQLEFQAQRCRSFAERIKEAE